MKILMVAPTPFFSDRGCHVHILNQMKALTASGCELMLCTYPFGRKVPDMNIARTWPVPWHRTLSQKLSAGPSWHQGYLDLMLLGLVRKKILHWHPDLVHAYTHEGACIAAAAIGTRPVPLILDYQGNLTTEVVTHGLAWPDGIPYRIFKKIENWIQRRADAILIGTDAQASDLFSDARIDPDKVHVLGDAMDTEMFRPHVDQAKIRERYGIAADVPLIIYAGMLNPYQGVNLLLEALSRLQQEIKFQALLIGFPNEDRYRVLAHSLGLGKSITFTGCVPFDQLPDYLNAADIAVSAKWSPIEGNEKLRIYMAAGLPIVAFDTPVNQEILGDAALLVPDIDASSLAGGLGELIKNETLRINFGRAARRRALQCLDAKALARRIERVYQGLRRDVAPPMLRPVYYPDQEAA